MSATDTASKQLPANSKDKLNFEQEMDGETYLDLFDESKA